MKLPKGPLKKLERFLLKAERRLHTWSDAIASYRYRHYPPPPPEEGSVAWFLREESHRMIDVIAKRNLSSPAWYPLMGSGKWPLNMGEQLPSLLFEDDPEDY